MKYICLSTALLSLFCISNCTRDQPSLSELQGTLEAILTENTNATNRYDWKESTELFDESGTYSQPAYGLHQQGKVVLDSVMKEITAAHQKDSLHADIEWKTKSLVLEDSVAYHVVKQHVRLKAKQKAIAEYEATQVIVWKQDSSNRWKVGYLLVYP